MEKDILSKKKTRQPKSGKGKVSEQAQTELQLDTVNLDQMSNEEVEVMAKQIGEHVGAMVAEARLKINQYLSRFHMTANVGVEVTPILLESEQNQDQDQQPQDAEPAPEPTLE